jgi:hypothetical protein
LASIVRKLFFGNRRLIAPDCALKAFTILRALPISGKTCFTGLMLIENESAKASVARR